MNILFLSREYPPKLVGGVGIYIYEASRILARLGHKVFVITEAIDCPVEYIDKGVHVFRVKLVKLGIFNLLRSRIKGFIERLEYSYSVSKKIKEVVSKHKIDIVESCEARAEGFWYYLFNNKPPLVVKLHTPEGIVYKLNRDPKSKDRDLIEKLEEWWINRANKPVGISKSVVDLTQKHYKIKFDNIPIVCNPIDSNVFKPAEVLSNKGYVLYVGRLEFRKGVHVLINAIPFILKKNPQVRFILIGNDCGMKGYIMSKISQLGIKESVELIDQISREKLVSYYQESAVCVFPSLWENHPYVILEAMACGKIVIASDVGGIPEIINDRVNGLLVPAGSSLCLASALKEALENKKLQEELGANARGFINEHYAPEKVVQKTLIIYKELRK